MASSLSRPYLYYNKSHKSPRKLHDYVYLYVLYYCYIFLYGCQEYCFIIKQYFRPTIFFTMAPLLHDGPWSTDGNFPSSATYWTNQNRSDYLKHCCDWLTILRPGSCTVQYKQLNMCTQSIHSFVQLGSNPKYFRQIPN